MHWSIVTESKWGIHNRTLCGRMDNSLEDGWNVGENHEVTCKHCLNASKQPWGQNIIKQADEYAN